MDDGPTTRFHLGGLNPFVFREAGIDDEKLVIDRSGRLHLERLGNREHDVGLRNAPALGKSGSRGASLGSPSGVPAAIQSAIVFFSSAVRRMSLAKWPYFGSACQGGMRP